MYVYKEDDIEDLYNEPDSRDDISLVFKPLS